MNTIKKYSLPLYRLTSLGRKTTFYKADKPLKGVPFRQPAKPVRASFRGFSMSHYEHTEVSVQRFAYLLISIASEKRSFPRFTKSFPGVVKIKRATNQPSTLQNRILEYRSLFFYTGVYNSISRDWDRIRANNYYLLNCIGSNA